MMIELALLFFVIFLALFLTSPMCTYMWPFWLNNGGPLLTLHAMATGLAATLSVTFLLFG